MNWIHFLLWLAGIYCLYYLTIIAWDTRQNKRPQRANGAANELSFYEQVDPQDAAGLMETMASTTDPKPKSTPEMIASGGVLLKDIFSLARKEAIVYLKEVSY